MTGRYLLQALKSREVSLTRCQPNELKICTLHADQVFLLSNKRKDISETNRNVALRIENQDTRTTRGKNFYNKRSPKTKTGRSTNKLRG